MKYLCLLLSCLIFLSACAPTRTVLMKNPQTGNAIDCNKIDPWRYWPWQDEGIIKDCVEKYKKAGYEEVK